ncbi:MAG: hypothetical protein RLZZ74_1162 [Cyanobacteriota bacterium]|jgi:hypothetical protein
MMPSQIALQSKSQDNQLHFPQFPKIPIVLNMHLSSAYNGGES